MPQATEAAEPPPEPVITDRWRHTSDGGRVPALMGMTHTGVTHRAYIERPSQDAPPSVKIGMLVACQPPHGGWAETVDSTEIDLAATIQRIQDLAATPQ